MGDSAVDALVHWLGTKGESAMLLQELLRDKSQKVHSIRPQATLADAVAELVRHNIGSLLVCESSGDGFATRLLGIVTERDVLRALAVHGAATGSLSVREVMTSDVLTASPQDSIGDAMGLMTQRRIRHLPVVEGGRLLGMISIGDVVKAQHDQFALENHYLKSYINS